MSAGCDVGAMRALLRIGRDAERKGPAVPVTTPTRANGFAACNACAAASNLGQPTVSSQMIMSPKGSRSIKRKRHQDAILLSAASGQQSGEHVLSDTIDRERHSEELTSGVPQFVAQLAEVAGIAQLGECGSLVG